MSTCPERLPLALACFPLEPAPTGTLLVDKEFGSACALGAPILGPRWPLHAVKQVRMKGECEGKRGECEGEQGECEGERQGEWL